MPADIIPGSRNQGIKPSNTDTRFSGGVIQALTPLASAISSMDRTSAMLLEDFIGFGGLRTGMDLLRNYFFGNREDGPFNIPAARERLLREILSILTDNISSGVAAFALGRTLDRRFKTFSNGFAHFSSLETFQKLVRKTQNEDEFLRLLSAYLAGQPHGHKTSQHLLNEWRTLQQSGWRSLTQASPTEETARLLADSPIAMARHLEQKEFGMKGFYGPELIRDVADFLHHVQAQQRPGESWQVAADKALTRTLRVKYAKLACLSIGFLLTFAVPYGIRWLTRKLDKEDSYPGERGFGNRRNINNRLWSETVLDKPSVFEPFSAVHQSLHQVSRPGQAEQWFPYISRAFNRGNPTPAILSAIPLLFTVGVFDTVSRRFKNPLAPGFLKYLRNAYDFGKGFPFTTQQQMASMFAFLFASRLSSARSANEFRERLVDTSMGWSLWILGTPLIKEWISRMLDGRKGTQLVKPGGGLRTQSEITGLIQDEGKTLAAHNWIGAISTLTTMVMLGVVEPYLAILWTKHNLSRQPGGIDE